MATCGLRLYWKNNRISGWWRMAGRSKHARALARFCLAYYPVSLLVTLLLVFFAYRDVVGLLYKMNFLVGGQSYSEASRQMLLGGFHTRLAAGLSDNLPLISMTALIVIIAY